MSLQMACASWLRHCPVLSIKFLLVSYIVGATANQNLFLAIHEISHNLAFKSATANRLFAVFANLPIGLPYSAAFRVSLLCLARSTAVRKSTDSDRLAVSSHASQVPRRRRSRYRYSNRLGGFLPRFHPGQSLLLHIPDPFLCPSPYDGLPAAIDFTPFIQCRSPIVIRHFAGPVPGLERFSIPDHELVPCGLATSMRWPLHC